jgi:putative PIN family toxin of toxin-antitoxin system
VLRAVLDANVFVAAAIQPEGPPSLLLRRFLQGDAFELVLSPSIAAEIAAALDYPAVRRCIRGPIDTRHWLDSLLLLADMVEDGRLPARVSPDPDDDKYLHAAVTGRAAVIVSGDKDLLGLGDYHGIRIVTPRGFLGMVDVGRG